MEEAKVHGDLTVRRKQSSIEGKVGEEGFMVDRFGNKVYAANHPKNLERLAELSKPEKPKARKVAKKKEEGGRRGMINRRNHT